MCKRQTTSIRRYHFSMSRFSLNIIYSSIFFPLQNKTILKMVFIVDQQNKARKLISASCKFSSLQNNTLLPCDYNIWNFLLVPAVPKEETNGERGKKNVQNLSRNVSGNAFAIENYLKSMALREPRTFIDSHARQLIMIEVEFYRVLHQKWKTTN